MSGVDSYSGRLEERRPLSPHLLIYRPMLTMVMSIMHRITGAALYFGTALLVWYLIALASGPHAFATMIWFFSSIIGQLILLGFTWALFNHFLGGIRHWIWDTGYGFTPALREFLAQATLVGGLILTALVWGLAYFFF